MSLSGCASSNLCARKNAGAKASSPALFKMKNNQLESLIGKLKEKSLNEKVKIWKAIAIELEKPTRNRRIVNLFKLDSHTKDNDTVIVPGKVLSNGEITHKITIAAYSFSKQAIEKIRNVQGTALTIEQLLEQNPKGEKVKIIG